MSGRVVVVTGGTAGVGRAVSRAFAAEGDHVAVLARGRERLDDTVAEIEARGVRGLACAVDVADAGAVEAAAARVGSELGEIDVWVNCAMTAVLAPVTETSAEDLRRVTEVTYLGFVHGTMSALKRMHPRDRGVIVQVGSGLAYRSIPLQASYCGAKSAMRGFTDALRTELLHDHSGVRVTMVHLPGMNTTQFGWVKTTLRHHPQPVPPIYQPEVAARAIVWAADHPRREVYVGAVTAATIWGGRLIPDLIDRYLARTNYEAQQSDIPIGPDRPNYVREPVPGHQAAHGIFDDVAHDRSPQLWAATHHGVVAAGLAAGVAVGATASALLARRRRR